MQQGQQSGPDHEMTRTFHDEIVRDSPITLYSGNEHTRQEKKRAIRPGYFTTTNQQEAFMITIKPKRAIAIALSLAAVTIAVLATSLPAAAHNSRGDGFGRVRVATARYFDLDVAQAAGYGLLKDTAGIACIANPGVGAMGVHYANGALLESGVIDALKPQVLVYAPEADGTLRLAAVEYVVLQSTWDATHQATPELFGESFMLTAAGNRYGLPAFYSMHAWVWESNPRGNLSMWNPRVHCPAPTAEPYN